MQDEAEAVSVTREDPTRIDYGVVAAGVATPFVTVVLLALPLLLQGH
jgi:hypothetical protein